MLAVLLVGAARAAGQVAAEARPAEDVARWRYLIEELAREARAVAREEQRARLVAEAADALWELDEPAARELFASALEAAWALKPGAQGAGETLRFVLRLAARRDAALARALAARPHASEAERERAASESISAANELLEADAERAAQLAEAGARAGPSLDVAWLILHLSQRDAALADRVYRAYLGRFAADAGLGLERLLWLAGHPFGYAEAFGEAGQAGQLVGFNGLRVRTPGPRPELAGAFLDAALRESQRALARAAASSPRRAEALHEFVLFAAAYLRPEVRRFRPRALPEWALVEQRALAATSVAQGDAAAQRVRDIVASRPRAGREPEPAGSDAGERAEDILARAEKLPAGCQRDVELARAALGFDHFKEFARALEVSGRVESAHIRDGLRQYVHFDMAEAAAARGDAVSLEEARRLAERVDSPEQRALLYARVARGMLRHGDRQTATALLSQAARLADRAAEPAAQASLLLTAAAGFAEFDAVEGARALGEAVKTVNRAAGLNVDEFRVLRKVSLACRPGEDTWFGGGQNAERFSLYETFAELAAADADGMLALARGLDDPPTRIRTLIRIARAMIAKARHDGRAR